MRFAKTVEEAGGLKKKGGGTYLRNFQHGESEVRFLLPTGKWMVYAEHFVEGRSLPCSQDEGCLGCNSDDPEARQPKEKVATCVWNERYEKVDAFRIPKGIYRAAQAREERRGTILDRVAFIDKSGKGLKTEYQLDWGDPSKFDTEERLNEAPDINEILLSMYDEAAGGNVNAAPKAEKDSFTEKELRAMNKDELLALASAQDIDIDSDLTLKEIRAEIMASA